LKIFKGPYKVQVSKGGGCLKRAPSFYWEFKPTTNGCNRQFYR